MNSLPTGATVIGLEQLAFVALILFTLGHLTTFRFQTFTLDIARKVVFGDYGSRDPKQVGALQAMMSPSWLGGLIAIPSYVLGIAAAFLGFPALGWLWVVGVVFWAVIGSMVLHPIWHLPTRGQCRSIAQREAFRSMGRFSANGDQVGSQLCSAAIIQLMAKA